jgi:hypothetical protein
MPKMKSIVASDSGFIAVNSDEVEKEIQRSTGLPLKFWEFGGAQVKEWKTSPSTKEGDAEITYPVLFDLDGRRIRGAVRIWLEVVEEGWGMSWQVVTELPTSAFSEREHEGWVGRDPRTPYED